MCVIKRSRRDDFAIIPNSVSSDDRLSFEARGVLCYLLAKPHDWRVNIVDVQNQGGFGRHKAYRIIRELRDVGYLELREVRNEFGHICGYEYIVYDVAKIEAVTVSNAPRANNRKTATAPENPPLASYPYTDNQDALIRTDTYKELNTISSLRSEIIDHYFLQNDGFCLEKSFSQNENSGLEPEPDCSKTGTENATETEEDLGNPLDPTPSRAKTTHTAAAQPVATLGAGLGLEAQNAPNLAKNEIDGTRTLFNSQDDSDTRREQKTRPRSCI